jgi:hypothetical protein
MYRKAKDIRKKRHQIFKLLTLFLLFLGRSFQQLMTFTWRREKSKGRMRRKGVGRRRDG